MKKIYNSPVMETMVLSAQLMQDMGGGGIIGSNTSQFAPKPRPDKPF